MKSYRLSVSSSYKSLYILDLSVEFIFETIILFIENFEKLNIWVDAIF